MLRLSELADRFAALAEPTRLRLMLACRNGDLLVGQFASSLKLPEPAVSRHLATLARAGLLSRERQGREVRYGWSSGARAAAWLEAALASAADGDTTVRRDQARLARLRGHATATPFAANTLFGQRLAAALKQLANNISSARVLAVDVTQGPVLAWLQESAATLTVVAAEPDARRAIAAYAREHDLAFDWANDSESGADYDLVCVMAVDAETLQQRLAEAALWLAAPGYVLLCLPYDQLDDVANEGGAHPLFRLRTLLSERGFSCERLLPVEAAGEHWLLASGVRAARATAIARRG